MVEVAGGPGRPVCRKAEAGPVSTQFRRHPKDQIFGILGPGSVEVHHGLPTHIVAGEGPGFVTGVRDKDVIEG